MKVIDRGTVFAGEVGTDHQSCCFPAICALPGGRWLCGCRAAPTKSATTGQHVLLTWSDDEGKTWSKPLSPFVPPHIDGNPGLFRYVALTALGGNQVLAMLYWVNHSDPSLPFFNEETEGILDSRLFLAKSEDAGLTWSEPKLVDTSPFNVPVAITGPVLILSNGAWACQFELNKAYYDTSVWRHSSVLMFSQDQGQSWPKHAITSNDPENRVFYWDQRPGVLADGTVLDVFWTYDNQAATYLNIHARESMDNGCTWSQLWDAGVPGQPAQPVSLPDGRIAMVYVDRTGPPAIKMRISSDKGRTWRESGEVVIHQAGSGSQTWNKGSMQDAWAEMGKFSTGLPATSPLQNGQILVVYYAGPDTDRTDIRWARLGEE
jgi:Neuraminidase (sialidase)